VPFGEKTFHGNALELWKGLQKHMHTQHSFKQQQNQCPML